MIVIQTVICAILCSYATALVLRHNMHMFQLNGYKNDEHFRWIRKNLRQQWLLGFCFVLGVIRMVIPVIWPEVPFYVLLPVDILIYLTLWLVILVYRAMHRIYSKKKLVYTARVRRMILTICILITLALLTWILGFIYFGKGIRPVNGFLLILLSAQIILNIVANVINSPMEKAISRHYINDAKRMLRNMPDLKIIGVTGSYGKTSVKFYLQTLLQDSFDVLVTPGNFNTPLGVTRTVREHLKPTHQIFICEMGARRVGEIKELCDLVHPDYGIITAVGPQHLDTFFSIENIAKTKFELADAVPSGNAVFLNGDNEIIREKGKEYPNAVFYSSDSMMQSGGYYAKDISVSQMGTDFTVVSPDGVEQKFQTKLIGAHNVINVLGAIAAANMMGISLKDLVVPVRKIQPVEHRMQLREHGTFTIIDDAYNSNPVGSKAAVETLAMFDGVRILITPGMVELGDKEEEYNRKFGTYAASCCDYILTVGKRRAEVIMEGALSEGFPENKCKRFDKLEDAMNFAHNIKDPGHKYILLENDLPDNY